MRLGDDAYSRARSHILAMDQLASIDKIFDMIQQEENHKHMLSDYQKKKKTPETIVAFATSHIV